jgi:hypothetical protein
MGVWMWFETTVHSHSASNGLAAVSMYNVSEDNNSIVSWVARHKLYEIGEKYEAPTRHSPLVGFKTKDLRSCLVAILRLFASLHPEV